MNVRQCDEWIRSRLDLLLDFVRVYLGAGLFIKGVFFLFHPERLPVPPDAGALAVFAQAVPYIHIIGGALLAAGVWTRPAALAQLPVLLGAVWFVHLPRLTEIRGREDVEFTALVFFLMVLVFIKGPGPLALSRHWPRSRAAQPGSRQAWIDTHPDVFLDVIRAYLGVGLVFKGIYIMAHREQFGAMMEQLNGSSFWVGLGMHYVIPVHMLGGLLLAIGLLTRPAALAQIPILLGVMVYVHLPRFLDLDMRQNLEFTALVLFLLAVITAHGSGRLSVDHLLAKQSEGGMAARPAG
jgi:uncharacterized membrane protein YphA (DoxX/SURF4 family)